MYSNSLKPVEGVSQIIDSDLSYEILKLCPNCPLFFVIGEKFSTNPKFNKASLFIKSA